MTEPQKRILVYVLAVLIVIIVTLVAQYAKGATYYVSNSGSNSHTGLSTVQAWLTIGYSVSQLYAGDTLFIMSGTYRENNQGTDHDVSHGGYYDIVTLYPTRSGTIGNQIVFKGYNSIPLLTSYSSDYYTHSYGIEIDAKSYLVFDSLEVKKTCRGISTMNGSNYCIIRNCIVDSTGAVSASPAANSAGIFWYDRSASRYDTVENCTLFHNVQDHNNPTIDHNQGGILTYGTYNLVLRNNTIYDIPAGFGIMLKESPYIGDVYGNTIYTGYNENAGILLYNWVDSISIHDNIIYDCSVGIQVFNLATGYTDIANKIYNNTIYNCGSGFRLTGADAGATTQDMQFYNNIMANVTTPFYRNNIFSTSGLYVDYNDSYNYTTLANWVGSNYSFSGFQGLGFEAHGAISNPLFKSTDSSKTDFLQLRPKSPDTVKTGGIGGSYPVYMGAKAPEFTVSSAINVCAWQSSDAPELTAPRRRTFTNDSTTYNVISNTNSLNQFAAIMGEGSRIILPGAQISGGSDLDMHAASAYWYGTHTAYPSSADIRYRYFPYPCTLSAGLRSAKIVHTFGAIQRATIAVKDTNNIWIASRTNDQNGPDSIRVFYSTNMFNSSNYSAVKSELSNSRIGLTLDSTGTPVLIGYLFGRGYYYWQWNGTYFAGLSDSAIVTEAGGFDFGNYNSSNEPSRVYDINYVGNRLHLIFGYGTRLLHFYQNGSGGWSRDTVTTNTGYAGEGFYPCSTVRGKKLCCFLNVNNVAVVKVWDYDNLAWDLDSTVVTGTDVLNAFISAPPNVPVDQDYIPINWCNTSNYVRFAKLDFSESGSNPGGGDITPPVISGITKTPDITTCTIHWVTDEAANWVISYGHTSSYGSTLGNTGAYQTSYTVQLTGLTPDYLYHFKITSCDVLDNCDDSNDYTFTTLPNTPAPGGAGSRFMVRP
jgi:hypothetical protein